MCGYDDETSEIVLQFFSQLKQKRGVDEATMAKSCELLNLSDRGSSYSFFTFEMLGVFRSRANKITGSRKLEGNKQKAKESPQIFFLPGV